MDLSVNAYQYLAKSHNVSIQNNKRQILLIMSSHLIEITPGLVTKSSHIYIYENIPMANQCQVKIIQLRYLQMTVFELRYGTKDSNDG